MKIRIKGNSVRFRLTQSEVRQLSETGLVEETTEFASGTFHYQASLAPGIQNLQASFEQGKIVLLVPEADGKDWFQNEIVGFETDMPLPEGKKLHLLLEKDFACLDNTTEDQSDNYPNPKMQC